MARSSLHQQLRGRPDVYAWIWEHLPGPTAVRLLVAVLMVAVLVVVCFAWVFPWVATKLPVDNFDQQPGAAAAGHRSAS